MSRLTKSLAVSAVAGVAVAASAAPASAEPPVLPETHTEAYWEAQLAMAYPGVDCVKSEEEDLAPVAEYAGMTPIFTYTKAGTMYYEESNGYGTGTPEKDISFIIRCYHDNGYGY